MSNLPSGAPSPRLCIIVKWPDFDGYGFNLHADKSKPGQYIGKVDANSPAEAAGLLENDRIVEVNGSNVANENHKQVVERIKAVPNETRLLVVDPQTDKYYKKKNIVVRGTQENVIVSSSAREQKSATPERQSQPAAVVSNGHHEEADNRSVSSAASSSATSEVSTQPQSPMSTSPTPPPSLEPAPEPVRSTPSPKASTTTTNNTTTTAANNANNNAVSKPASNNNAYNSSGLNLNMSAAEMRAKLASKKKADPRRDTVDLKKKYEIIQNM